MWGQRLFLTAFADGKLLTLAFDLGSGRELWRREVVPDKIEEFNRSLGNPASATPVTDGERIYPELRSSGVNSEDRKSVV